MTQVPKERPKAGNPKSLSGLLPFLRPYRVRIGLALCFLVLAAMSTLAFPLALRSLIDGGLVQANKGEQLMALREQMKGQDMAFSKLINGMLVRVHPPANMCYRLLHVSSVVNEPNNPTWGAYFCPLGPPESPVGTEEERRRLWLSGDDVSARHPYMMNEVSDSMPSPAEVTGYLQVNKPNQALLATMLSKRAELNAMMAR